MMKVSIFTGIFAIVLGAFFPYCATAQYTGPQNDRTRISIETDPTTFLFNGYSAHLRIQPKRMDHMLIGVGIYALDLPDVFVNLNGENHDEGWNVRISQAYSFFGEHHFTEVNRRWFVGGQLAFQEYELDHEDLSGTSAFWNGLVRAYGGYTFQPFPFNLYFKPWAGVGYSVKVSGSKQLGPEEFDLTPPPLFLFATLHVGYTF